jgi:uncharacterized protein
MRYFLTALALLFVFEGVLPFLTPARWRTMMLNLASMHLHHIRIIGLCSMLFGVFLLYLVS